MAGLVDYGVDSDKESDDNVSRESPKRDRKRHGKEPDADTSKRHKTGSSSESSKKTSKPNEVKKSSRSKDHHKHRRRSRDSHKRRSRSRSKDRKGHREERKKRRQSKSRSRSSSRDRRRPANQERLERKAAATSVAVSSHPEPVQPIVEQKTGVALPSFYNPAAVNPIKYAQQIQKRKLLWAGKEKETPNTSTAKLWEATALQDNKMTAKFKRLMGIKNEGSDAAGPSNEAEPVDPAAEVLKKQQELFASLDQQYQVARATTHTQRGLGLGFSSTPR